METTIYFVHFTAVAKNANSFAKNLQLQIFFSMSKEPLADLVYNRVLEIFSYEIHLIYPSASEVSRGVYWN